MKAISLDLKLTFSAIGIPGIATALEGKLVIKKK
jgi:hypothetical protein